MELLNHLQLGFETALTLQNLLYCFVGVFFGTLIGVLPGLGPVATIAMLLPATFVLEPVTALIMLSGIYYGAQYGGSTTAILINLPGEASSVVTALDGHAMARKGRAGVALATAAMSSFFAGTVATLLLALAAPPLASVALSFGPPEYCALIVLGLIASIVLSHGSLIRAIGMILIGLTLGMIGVDANSGMTRMTFNVPELYDGLDFVAVAMGMFGIGEILRNLENESTRVAYHKHVGSMFPSKEDWRRMFPSTVRGTFIGSALGVLPGGGALLSSFAAYAVEKKVSKHGAEFGDGAIEGVAAPEAANNAGSQTSFVPMLTLGIPSNSVMALMIGAMIIQGIQPGPAVIEQQPALFWGIIASMWIGNLMLVILNLPLVGLWAKLLTIPYHFLFPGIAVICSIGVFTMNGSEFDVFTMAAFGILGYVFGKLGCELTPLLLGFLLGPMLEGYLRRSLTLSHGDFSVFAERPIAAGLLLTAVGIIALMALPSFKRTREEAFVEED
ncbi:tripartite tricarboxylate transporter permease [Cereibacter sp. SYSU M97828]|nr:tripartite tricarboxylate transporter permease [Cereibacter flavus]